MRYKAFMSYCHADESWAAWLHKALESYRVPKRLAGKPGMYGPVAERLTPIFRDREELSPGLDLSEKIKEALAESESLLVICSPAAAHSRWVNEEIRYFRSLGRERRTYCIIVDGDPQSTDPQQNCFPPALLETSDQNAAEPLAADVRKWADGKSLAKLKIVSGILGVRLDELRQREQQRKRKIRWLSGVALLAIIALVLFSIQSRLAEKSARMAREAQQASAERMLAQFLEQSERLGDVADIETRKAFGEVLSGYLAKLDPSNLTLESRRQLGVALLNRGVILRDEGQLDEAMTLFGRARETLQHLVEESRADAEALFELSQVEYWIGRVHLDLGQIQEASKSYEAYAEVSATLHALEPDNADWTMEAAYAQSNLGNLESRKILSDSQLTLQYQQAALELNEKAALQDPKYESELAESHANVADAWLGVCGLSKAMEHRIKNVELAARYHGLNPVNNRLKQDYAYALSGLSIVQLMAGEVGEAAKNLQKSVDLHAELVEADPSNFKKRWNLVRKQAMQARVMELSGQSAASWELDVTIEREMKNLIDQEEPLRIDYALAYGMFLRDFADRAYRRADTEFANHMMSESIEQLERLAAAHPDDRNVPLALARSYFYYWENNNGQLPSEAGRERLSGMRATLKPSQCSELEIAVMLSLMAAEEDEARTYAQQLIDKGYHEPQFVTLCRAYGLYPE